MSLTATDLQAISTVIKEEVPPIVRGIIEEEVPSIVRPIVREEVRLQIAPLDRRLGLIEGRLEAVENDVKDIYYMVADLQVAVAGRT